LGYFDSSISVQILIFYVSQEMQVKHFDNLSKMQERGLRCGEDLGRDTEDWKREDDASDHVLLQKLWLQI